MKNIKEILLGLVFVGIIGAGIYFSTVEKKLPEGITKTVVETGVEEYKGKNTVVLVAGTFCPHCQREVPVVEKEIFEKTSSDALNLVTNVIDGEKGKSFNTKIKQVFNKDLGFEELTGEACEFVPSWVVMDAEWKVVDSDCGNKKQISGLVETLKKVGVEFEG